MLKKRNFKISSTPTGLSAQNSPESLRAQMGCISETGLGHPSSNQGGLLNRKQDRFWMGREKGRGGLFRLEKEGLITKGGSHTLAALDWQDQRHEAASRSQVF